VRTADQRRTAYAELTREVRTFAIEHRMTDDGELEFSGYASTYDTPYTLEDFFGEYTEEFVSGSFTKTLAQRDDVVLLINHEGLPLARTTSKTLDLSEDSVGLKTEALLVPTDPDVMRIQPKMDRGDLSQMSIAFRALRQEWNEDYTHRKILEAKLYDVSVVTNPANPYTSATLRGVDLLRAIATVDPEELLTAVRSAPTDGARDLLHLATANLEQLTAELFPPAVEEAAADDPDAQRDTPTTISIDIARRQLELMELSGRR
jgi:HK97 family phage prohead protease